MADEVGIISSSKKFETECPSLKLSSGWNSMRAVSSEVPSGNVLQKVLDGEKNNRDLKSKRCSVSLGSVSGVIGKQYAKSRPLTADSTESKKPLKLDSRDFPVDEIWSEKNPPSMIARTGTVQVDVEEFLFKMLGHGFQLDVTVIQEVLGLCGYDMQKCVDKLLDLSASTLEKFDDLVGMAAEESTEKCSDLESSSLQEQMQQLNFAQSDGAGLMARNSTDPLKREKDRFSLQKEILETLFDFPVRSEETPKKVRLVREVRRSRAFAKPLFEPHNDAAREPKPSASETQAVTCEEEEDDENSYESLRKAVKEYWITMKEYYQAAVDAFAKGDHARAQKLLDQGQFFNKRAREADEKSFQKLVETREDEVVSLNLHGLEPKEALRLLRLHLTTLSGIPSIKYLQVIIENDDEEKRKGAQKRLIMRLLEKESIKWTDGGSGKTILIQVDMINPKSLSFAGKYASKG